ncbi:MAG: hypothetical protein WDO13_05395 [Verrucomicrobiota bacterium]
MAALFHEVPEALACTREIADKCNLKIVLGENKFPAYTVPEGDTREGYLRRLCFEGLERRFPDRHQEPALRERLDFELNVLLKTGFTSYFLIVWDFIHYAKTHGIPVGPGRGSAAGSLIAYVLGITDLDPLKYGLFFERFLNPERNSPPDIDVDFCYNRRPEVIDYVREKVRREVGRADHHLRHPRREDGRARRGPRHGPELRRGRPLTKMIPFDPKMTLEKALQDSPDFKRAYDEEETSHSLIDTAMTLEGVVAPGRRARRRRRHLRPRPDRLRATDQGRPRGHRHAVFHGSARRARPAQNGLPRAQDADRHRGRAAAHRADHRPKPAPGRHPARRSQMLRAPQPRAKTPASSRWNRPA